MPLSDVIAAVKEQKVLARRAGLFRDYYDGRHQLKFATQDFETKYGRLVLDLRENLCPGVVSAFTDKLAIRSWGDKASVDEATDQGLTRLLEMVHREAFRCGDAFVLVWPGADRTPKARYHRADQIVPHVDPVDPDRLDWAAKPWVDRTIKRGRVSIWYADRFERWATKSVLAIPDDGTSPELPESAEAWEPYEDADGPAESPNEFGVVPVCWWKRDADDNEGHGRSVLTDVIPIQDALNKSIADLVIAGETYSRPFWYLLNYKPEQQQNPLLAAQAFTEAAMSMQSSMQARQKFDPTRQRIFTHDGNGPFGQLDPPDLTKVVAVQDAFAHKVGRVVGIPSYYLSQTSGDVPSGESLRVLSSRLNSAVRAFQKASTPVLRGLLQLLSIESAPEWETPMPLDELEQYEVAQHQHDLGYALADIVRGLGEEDPDGIVQRAAEQRANVGAVAANQFRNGTTTFDS